MFEKEAEEYTDKYDIMNADLSPKSPRHIVLDVFKAGAEFGYNKSLEEIGDLRDCSNCKHWEYSTRSLSYFCDKTDRIDDIELQHYRCEHWEQ